MLAEMFSKLPQYIEAPLLGADEAPSIALPLTEVLAFREKRSIYNEIQNLVASVIFKTKKHLYGELFTPRLDVKSKGRSLLEFFFPVVGRHLDGTSLVLSAAILIVACMRGV